MKSTVIFLLAIYWASAAPKTSHEGIVPKRETFHLPKSQDQYGLFFSERVSIEDYPYTAVILTGNNQVLGGGMIYKDQWVITSGSVGTSTSVSNMMVRVGSSDALDGGQLFNVTKVFNPPLYENCASLIKLNEKIKFGKTAKPISIAKYVPHLGGKCNVTGFGESETAGDEDHLQRRKTEYYDRQTCRDNWWTYVGPSMGPTEICAISTSCYGDEGDPLVQDGKAVGVFIHTIVCTYDFVPVVFCNLTKLRKWINITIKNDKHVGRKHRYK